MSRVSNHLRSNVVGYVAVFIALSGTAYAVDGPLPGQDQVGSADIIDNEVFGEDVRNDQIFSRDVRDDTLPNGGLTGTDIADESLSGSDLGFGAVESADIFDGSITAADLATDAVGTSEIQTSGVGQTEIQTNGVAGAEIVDQSVRSAELNLGAVGAADVASIVTRTNTVSSFGDGALISVTATCNAGERLISGGADWTPTRFDTHLIESRRSTANSGNAWFVAGAVGVSGPGFEEDPADLTAQAYCLPAGT
jgi:hypothetical protein